jgi:SAM-dependent methyltransferase
MAQEHPAATMWKDPAFARTWSASDGLGNLLALPWALAAAIVGDDNPAPDVVVDVASGPGAFLAAFLEEFPHCRGIWLDASETMREQARERLARFGDRVELRIGDMTDLAAAGLPGEVAAIMTSRAAHHLDRAELAAFYTEAAAHLAPGGWLINLDHTGPVDVWDRRFRAVRRRFIGPRNEEGRHHHNYPLTSIQDHLHAFAVAGIDDIEIAWKAFYTCLFMGRKASSPTPTR